MKKTTFKFLSKISVVILCILGLTELGLALWTIFDNRYKSLAYNLADVGYMDLWILRYLSLCLFASSIITLVMCLILIWGLCSAHVFLFIASTMIVLILIGEFTISILTLTSKYETRLTLIEQLPKLVITYRQGTDERAKRALDILQLTFRCCGADGRLSFQNNVPLSCNMFYVGCLTRTLFFLDACMDALAYILLFFSLIKLFIIIFFYSFLCLYQRQRQKRVKRRRYINDDSSICRYSSSFDSSSTDNLPRKTYITSIISSQDENENDYIEKRRGLPNEYDSPVSLPNRRIQNTSIISPSNGLPSYYEKNVSRKLSSISEKTEKNETDESEPDLLRLKHYKPERIPMITTIVNPSVLPRKVPFIKTRRKIIREDDNDSGVERSSSEKSFDDHNIQKPSSDTPAKPKSPSSLSFSKVFVTSVSNIPSTDNDIIKESHSTSLVSENLHQNDVVTPKSILKKSNQQSPSTYRHQKTSPLLLNGPKIIPRTNIKQ